MDKKIDKRIIKTKKALYDALIKIMKDKTFEEVKIKDICDIALINRSTFYDHFQDKYELLDSLINDLKNELIKTLEKTNKNNSTAKEYYLEVIQLFLEHISSNIDIYNSVLKKNNNSIVMDMVYETIYKDIEKELKEKDYIETNIPVEIITKFYVTAVVNICLEYIKFPKKYQTDTILKYFEELIPDKIYEK